MKKRISLALAFIYILTCVVMPAYASKLDQTKQQNQKVKSQITDIAKQKKEAADLIKKNKEQKAYLEDLALKEKKNLDSAITQEKVLKADINRISNEIVGIEKEFMEKEKLFKTRMKVLYQNMGKTPVEVFVESKGISAFFSRLQLMSVVKENDEKLIQEISMGKEKTELKKQERLLDLKEKEEQLQKISSKVGSISSSRAKVQSNIEDETARLKNLEKKEDELIKLSDQLEKKILQLMDNNKKYAGGVMLWPTPGYTRVGSPYGMRMHPIYHRLKMHTGIDIDAPMGAKIVASNNGKVIMAGWNGGYGNCVIVDHGGGIATLYAHQSKILVKEGQHVDKGEVIGKVGSTGLSTGPHLHYEVRKNGATKNPRDYV